MGVIKAPLCNGEPRQHLVYLSVIDVRAGFAQSARVRPHRWIKSCASLGPGETRGITGPQHVSCWSPQA
jgi:hypothetical protein